jgi:hypothetical protein
VFHVFYGVIKNCVKKVSLVLCSSLRRQCTFGGRTHGGKRVGPTQLGQEAGVTGLADVCKTPTIPSKSNY